MKRILRNITGNEMVLFNSILHPLASVLITALIVYYEFLVHRSESPRWGQMSFHLLLFLLATVAFVPYLGNQVLNTYLPLGESALLGALIGVGVLIFGKNAFESPNKIIAEKKKRIGQKIPVLIALVFLTISNHFGQVYSFYLFWIICLAFLPLIYNYDKIRIFFYQYAGFVFSLSASFLVTLNSNLSFYEMRISQNFFFVVGLMFLLVGVANVSKIKE